MNINKTFNKIVMKAEGDKKSKNNNLVMSDIAYSYKLSAKTNASKLKTITVK